jgi:6-phosphogluconolactonase
MGTRPLVRLTLTLPVLNHAAAAFFLAAGVAKADAVRQALTGPRDPLACPAGAVRPVDGDPVWWLDEGAAALLRRDRNVR